MTHTQELLNALQKELLIFGEKNQKAGITMLDAEALVSNCTAKISELQNLAIPKPKKSEDA